MFYTEAMCSSCVALGQCDTVNVAKNQLLFPPYPLHIHFVAKNDVLENKKIFLIDINRLIENSGLKQWEIVPYIQGRSPSAPAVIDQFLRSRFFRTVFPASQPKHPSSFGQLACAWFLSGLSNPGAF